MLEFCMQEFVAGIFSKFFRLGVQQLGWIRLFEEE